MDIPAVRMTVASGVDSVASNDHLLTEIFLRLPVRSIIRFKPVCKRWYSLLTDLYFVSLRNRIPTHPPAGLFLETWRFGSPRYEFVPFDENPAVSIRKPPFKHLNFANKTTRMVLVHSSNAGLMLCHPDTTKMSEPSYVFHVYNPTTGSYSALPGFNSNRSSGKVDGNRLLSARIAFDPSKSPHYRVVLLWHLKRHPAGVMGFNSDYQVEIYSSETRNWRFSGKPLSTIFPLNRVFLYGGGVYWDGVIHWLHTEYRVVWCFDLDAERFYRLPTPHRGQREASAGHRDAHWHDCCLFESGGCLLVINARQLDSLELLVYKLARDHSAWFLRHHLHLDPMGLTRIFPEFRRKKPMNTFSLLRRTSRDDARQFISIRYFVLGKRKEDSFVVLHVRDKIIKYNIRSKAFKKLSDNVPPDHSGAFVFVESLSLV